ncbi:MAG: Acid phosphatase [Acidimicrobiales bacterium]|nr:MAG: histidine phosphatase family protein [Actinomycetota bacterium]MBV6507808.1 Acid phosphatase [Acidimicrobiales bacterium]RIK05965.1 MAG: histidine phosphatase family protein [Acidobacteriota bacterium]
MSETGRRDTGEKTVVIVRHGETDWSRSGRHTGSTDLPLTGEGRRKATRLAPALGRFDFSHVFTSPLQRAVETCELAGLGGRAERLDDLLEWNYGELEGVTTAEIHQSSPDWNLWIDGAPGGESPPEVAGRADDVIALLRRILAEEAGDVALFGHGHFSVALCVRWIRLPISSGRGFNLDTGSLSALGWHHSDPVIRLFNERPEAGVA